MWGEFKGIRYTRGMSDFSRRYPIAYEARFDSFVTDIGELCGFGNTEVGMYDFGVNVLGSFLGNATISVRVSDCEKRLKMNIRNVFSVESLTRNPVTRKPIVTTPFLPPVSQYFIYDIKESLK